MDFAELRAVVDNLDRDLSKENAKISIQKYGGDLDESFIVGTQNGYLRLGVELLKAGVAPYPSTDATEEKKAFSIEVELDYVIDDDSDVQFDYFERTEDLKVRAVHQSFTDRLIPFVVLGVVGLILVLAIFGAITVAKSLF